MYDPPQGFSCCRTEGENSMDTEGEGEPLNPNEIELVFKPHPTEMTGDNQLMRALCDNSVRYLKTTPNASGEHTFCFCIVCLDYRQRTT